MIPEADIMVASEHRDVHSHSRFRLSLSINDSEAKSFVTVEQTSFYTFFIRHLRIHI
jgi:hypothetical protein